MFMLGQVYLSGLFVRSRLSAMSGLSVRPYMCVRSGLSDKVCLLDHVSL